jgi:outer membrane receptor protein involved in Fe transport
MRGSWFTLFRDDSMNARTETERLADVDKQEYRRYQYGGSVGGPIARDRVHYFAAFERTQQDTFQAVDTLGLFPSENGVFATPYRETLLTGKATANVSPSQYLSVRYGRNSNSQPFGADGRTPPSGWGESTNEFNSINANHNWVLGGMLNEFIFQYADFANAITANSLDPYQLFPNGVAVGQNPSTPQQTQQKKWQFRDDFTWHVTGMGGLGHDFKAGVNFINEPRLFITFNTGTGDYAYTHIDNDINGPIQLITLNGGAAEGNIPLKQYAGYIQDDWRLSDRLTVNLGYRYDLVTGYAIDQSLNPVFVTLQNAARAGRFAGLPLFEGFGEESKEDTNNHQPRVGVVYDVKGDGRDVLRAGYGIYYDVSYTNASILFAAIDATGIGAGTIFSVTDSGGIRNPDGSVFRVGQPISNIASQNEAGGSLPLNGHAASPRIKMPYSHQASVGWSHQLNDSTAVDFDFIHTEGRDIGWRPRPNQRVPGAGANAPRIFADLGVSPANFRTNVSTGKSRYTGANVGLRRRFQNGWSYNAWYSLASAVSTTGNAADELDSNNIIDVTDPYRDVQVGPTRRTDARHRINITGVFEVPGGFQVSPIFRFRSSLPVWLIENIDLNQDGQNNDLPAQAYAYDGMNDDGSVRVKEIGPCETINCGRGAPFSQLNLRISKTFPIGGRARLEAIGEIFNVFNAKNPDGFVFPNRRLNSPADPTQSSDFLRPTEFAGDFQNPEQRVGQVGFRLTF